jgi:hypothetical protein
LEKGKKYKVKPLIENATTHRDIKFDIKAEYLFKSRFKMIDSSHNHLFAFRRKNAPQPDILTSMIEAKGEWNIHNSGGSTFRLDHNPQFIVTITKGDIATTTAKIKVRLEHTGEKKMNPMLFYVFDIDRYLMVHTHHMESLVQHRFLLTHNEDKVDRIFKSKITKINQPSVEGIITAHCDWDLDEKKFLLVVPCVGLEGRSGCFKLIVECIDEKKVEDRAVSIAQIREFRYKFCEILNGNWIKGVSGGEFGAPLFAYNPCYEIKIEEPNTYFMCVLQDYELRKNEDIRPRIAMYMFEGAACRKEDDDHDHFFTQENMKSQCKWVSPDKVLISGMASPDIVDDQKFPTFYYVICTTYEEGLEASFQLKVYSNNSVTVTLHTT